MRTRLRKVSHRLTSNIDTNIDLLNEELEDMSGCSRGPLPRSRKRVLLRLSPIIAASMVAAAFTLFVLNR